MPATQLIESRPSPISLRQRFVPLVLPKSAEPLPVKPRGERHPNGKNPLPDEVYLKVHRERLHPLAAARKLKVASTTVRNRQIELGKMPHLYTKGERANVSDLQLRMEHAAGSSTYEAGANLNLAPSSVLKRWKKMDLKPPIDKKIKLMDDDSIKAYTDGLSPIEAGKKFNVDRFTVYSSWRFFNLPADGLKRQIPDSVFAGYLDKGCSAELASTELKIKKEIVMRRFETIRLAGIKDMRKDPRVKVTDRDAIKAYTDGLNTIEAGKRHDVTHATIMLKWSILKLPTDAMKNQIPDSVFCDFHEKRYSAALTARQLKIKKEIVMRRWVLMELPPIPKRTSINFLDSEIVDAHKRGLTNNETAKELDVSQPTVSRGFYAINLVPHDKRRPMELLRT